MKQPYYFLGTVTFPCANCGKNSIETIGSESAIGFPDYVAAGLTREKYVCQVCGASMRGRTKVKIHLEPVSLLRFQTAGFLPVPEGRDTQK